MDMVLKSAIVTVGGSLKWHPSLTLRSPASVSASRALASDPNVLKV